MAGRSCIVIVGGGFSGAAAAIHLSRLASAPLDLRIVEPRELPGAGLAHSAVDPDLRLNGPDAIHSPYSSLPNDFAEWMRSSGELEADPDAMASSGLVFPRRGAFGRYMAAELERHARSNPSGSVIEHVRQAALAVGPRDSQVVVELANGKRITADYCILALGWNEVGVPGALAGIARHRGWFADPWRTGRFDGIGRGSAVLLVGSGLTASDTFAVLTARGHQGPVLALSRRGLRPASQNPFRSTRSIWERIQQSEPPILRKLDGSTSLRSTLQLLRQQIAGIDKAVSSWHVPFDEVRDAARLVWASWSTAEQRQYLRHIKPWYDAYRFRNPPQTEDIVRKGVQEGRLAFAAGNLRSARGKAGGLEVTYEPRGNKALRALQLDAVVNCTGPQPRPGASRNPVWRSLLESGAARDAACGAGIDVDNQGRMVHANGQPHERLFAVGPPTIGQFAEVIAVPFIVRGILDVANTILSAESKARSAHQPR